MKTTCQACGQALPEPCGLVVDPDRGEVRFDGKTVYLTGKQMRIMQALANGRGRVISRDAMFNALYFDQPASGDIQDKIIDVFVCKIRQALAPFKAAGVSIKLHRGRGWELILPGLASKAEPSPLTTADLGTLQYGGPRS